MALLEITNLTVEFATVTGSLRAVDGINLSVDEREILAIVGGWNYYDNLTYRPSSRRVVSNEY